LIIFTEHRDTLTFLVTRLERIGLVGRIAAIHGGLNYRERAEQVAFFRRDLADEGARVLVATDAAGEGINLQFCWLMVNYDIPWNPARLEQRMGRIHRFGQKKDPVIIMNLVAGQTREGKVLKVLLKKLEAIREQLGSDKVFDVVGKLFEGKSIRDYIALALTEHGAETAMQAVEQAVSFNQVKQLVEAEQARYGQPQGVVRQALPRLEEVRQQEFYRKLMPGYVMGFIRKALPLLDLTFKGDLQTVFTLHPQPPKTQHVLLAALGSDVPFTVQRPNLQDKTVFLHPGQSHYELFSDYLLDQFAAEALQGGCFADPTATEPYLFQVLRLVVERKAEETHAIYRQTEQIEVKLVGIKQGLNGEIEPCPIEHLLLLKPTGLNKRIPIEPDTLIDLLTQSEMYAQTHLASPMLAAHRQRLEATMPERKQWVIDGFNYEASDLMRARQKQNERKTKGHRDAVGQITRIRNLQQNLRVRQELALQVIDLEPTLLQVGEVAFVAHALVYPTNDPEIKEQYNQQIEQAAMQAVWAYETARGATLVDVTTPDKARAAGLSDHPGFDILSHRPNETPRCIEVKGRAQTGKVELTENEWSQACILRGQYWLYVVYNCTFAHPDEPLRIQDPFGKQLKAGVVFKHQEIITAARATEDD